MYDMLVPHEEKIHMHYRICQIFEIDKFNIQLGNGRPTLVHFKRLGSRHNHKEIEIS